ncbi:MAG: hypothetical protein ISS61_14670 [Desulfobacteraceae bacterium]|nr:hypothetical protein [Desulfobacteraceae bacterium]
MKSIKKRVRALKKRLALFDTSGSDKETDEILKLEQKLGRLKVDWERWEEKRRLQQKRE